MILAFEMVSPNGLTCGAKQIANLADAVNNDFQ